MSSNGTLSVPVALDGSDLETVDAALAKAKKRRLRLCVPASYVRMEYSCHKKPGKILEIVPETLKKCKEKCGDLELFVEDATRADEAFLKDLVTSAIEAGVTAVTFADDEGATMPDEFGAFIADQKKNIPALEKVRVGAFCSNAFGLSLTSLLAAIKAGADEIKLCAAGSACATVGAFAAIVNAKGEKLGWKTDLLYTELNRICAQIAWTTDTKRSETSPFDSGVSDHSLPETELCEDDDISAVSAAVRKLGYDLSEEDDARVFEAFKRVAAKKPVGAKELDAIVASSALQVISNLKKTDRNFRASRSATVRSTRRSSRSKRSSDIILNSTIFRYRRSRREEKRWARRSSNFAITANFTPATAFRPTSSERPSAPISTR